MAFTSVWLERKKHREGLLKIGADLE
jgi:hypothetical protein